LHLPKLTRADLGEHAFQKSRGREDSALFLSGESRSDMTEGFMWATGAGYGSRTASVGLEGCQLWLLHRAMQNPIWWTSNDDPGGTPDRFTFSILDNSGVLLPTLAPIGDYFLGADLGSGGSVFDAWGSDLSRAPSIGNRRRVEASNDLVAIAPGHAQNVRCINGRRGFPANRRNQATIFAFSSPTRPAFEPILQCPFQGFPMNIPNV
jgi:hypothetical protein